MHRTMTLALALVALACGASPRQEHPTAVRDETSITGERTYTAEDLWLEPPRVYGPIFFAEELHPVADAVAAVMARPELGGYRVVPPAELRALWSNVQRGRLPGLAEVCTAQPPPARLAETLYEGSSRAAIRVDCESEACQLVVVIKRLEGDRADGETEDREVARYGTELAAGQSPDEWAEQIRERGLEPLPPPEPQEMGGILGVLAGGLGSEPGTYVSVRSVRQSGGWDDELTDSLFQPHADAFEACARPEQVMRDWWAQYFVIEVDGSGVLQRCDHHLPDHLPEPAFACQCEVLEKIDFESGPPRRRAMFDLMVSEVRGPSRKKPGHLRRSIYLAKSEASDPTAILGSDNVDGERLSACVEALDRPMDLEIPARFTVRADGRVTSHSVSWPDGFPADVAGCLDEVLAEGRFNCPLSKRAEVRALLDLLVEPQGPPIELQAVPET